MRRNLLSKVCSWLKLTHKGQILRIDWSTVVWIRIILNQNKIGYSWIQIIDSFHRQSLNNMFIKVKILTKEVTWKKSGLSIGISYFTPWESLILNLVFWSLTAYIMTQWPNPVKKILPKPTTMGWPSFKASYNNTYNM